MTATITLLKQRDMTAMARINALIEANRNPAVSNHDEFDAWMDEPKAYLFKRRAAEVLKTMRIMRLVAAETGGNPGWEVARQQARFEGFMKQARAEILRAGQPALRRAA